MNREARRFRGAVPEVQQVFLTSGHPILGKSCGFSFARGARALAHSVCVNDVLESSPTGANLFQTCQYYCGGRNQIPNGKAASGFGLLERVYVPEIPRFPGTAVPDHGSADRKRGEFGT